MRIRSGIAVSILLLLTLEVVAQIKPRYSQYILNPFIYNPAFAAKDGRYELHFNHRRQWIGIRDAPVVSTVSLQRGFSSGMAAGISAYSYKRGLIQTTNFQLTIGYQARLGHEHRLQMGLTGIVTQNSLDYSRISNPNDPVVMTGFTNNFMQDGQFGINYHLKGFNLGVTLNSLMNRNTVSNLSTGEQTFQPLNNYIINADYRFTFSQDRIALQPYLLYFATPDVPRQWEAGSILYLCKKAHVGGSYRQDYGATAMAGFTISRSLSLGYAYEFATRQVSSPGQGSHEVLLSIQFGKPTSIKTVKKPEPKENLLTVEEEPNIEETTHQEQPKTERISEPEETKTEEQNPVLTEETNMSGQPQEQEEEIEESNEDEAEPLPQKTFKAGTHQDELAPGYYVVAGVFGIKENAIKFTAALWQKSLRAAYGYNSQTAYYYVYLKHAQDKQAIRLQTLKLRKQPGFSKAWMLRVK